MHKISSDKTALTETPTQTQRTDFWLVENNIQTSISPDQPCHLGASLQQKESEKKRHLMRGMEGYYDILQFTSEPNHMFI